MAKGKPESENYIDKFRKRFFDDRSNEWRGDKNPPVRWLGIKCKQNPLDAWITQEIISEMRPDFVIETGTHVGGSALLWASILIQVNPKGRVISVNIREAVVEKAKAIPISSIIDFLTGDSISLKIVSRITDTVGNKSCLVILDADHSDKHVFQEIKLYSKFINIGGYLIVQDTWKYKDKGPRLAVRQFLREDNRFVADRTWERFLVTFNPEGFLRRVK